MTTTTPDSTVTEVEDRLAIIELIGRLSLAIDGRDWDAMGQLFTDTVNMQGTHVLANATGGPVWTVGGRHVHQLKRTPGGWRSSGLTFTLQWATGNMNVLELSMAAGA
jgi:hypothetical protein